MIVLYVHHVKINVLFYIFCLIFKIITLSHIYTEKGSIKMNNNYINRNQIYFNLFHLHTCIHFIQFI